MLRRPTVVVLFFGLLPLVSVGWQLRIHWQLNLSLLHFFSYYTNLSNILAGCVLLWSIRGRGRATALLRLMTVINMSIVGVVFALLLRDSDLGSLLPWINVVLHYLMPCAVALDWLLWPPQARLQMSDVAVCLLFPLLYLAYTLLRGDASGWYPYPFLNPLRAGYGAVAAYALGISALFVATGLGWLAVARRRQAART